MNLVSIMALGIAVPLAGVAYIRQMARQRYEHVTEPIIQPIQFGNRYTGHDEQKAVEAQRRRAQAVILRRQMHAVEVGEGKS